MIRAGHGASFHAKAIIVYFTAEREVKSYFCKARKTLIFSAAHSLTCPRPGRRRA